MEVFHSESLVNACALALRGRRESASVRRIAKPAGISIEDDVDAKSHPAA